MPQLPVPGSPGFWYSMEPCTCWEVVLHGFCLQRASVLYGKRQAAPTSSHMMETPGETHLRRGMARRSEGSSNSRSICVCSLSRMRRNCSSRSERDACLGGGSSIDQKRCRPAPGMMGQVSVRPLQRMTPSSQETPNEGSVVCAEMSNGMPSSPSA